MDGTRLRERPTHCHADLGSPILIREFLGSR